MHAQSFMNSHSRKVIADAIRNMSHREAVYFDAHMGKWVTSMPSNCYLSTRFGELQWLWVRPVDGVIFCKNASSNIYLSSGSIARTEENTYVENCLLPKRENMVDMNDDERDSDEYAIMLHGSTSTSLTTMCDLRGCYLTHEEIKALSSNMCGNPHVTQLVLSGNHLGDADMELLATALTQNASIIFVNLSYNNITTSGSTLLAIALGNNSTTKIATLDLSYNHIGSDGIHAWLGETLRTNKALETINLNHNCIGENKGNELLSSLAPTPLTQELQIKHAIARRRTAGAERQSRMILQTLDSSSPVSVDIHKDEQSEIERWNSTLKSLLLTHTGIGDAAAEYINRILRYNDTLIHLDISCNLFTRIGIENIASGIQHNKCLRILNVNEITMDDVAAACFISAFKHHCSIEVLKCQACFSSSSVCMGLAMLLRLNKTIHTLDLSYCHLQSTQVLEFYKSLGINSTITNLDMSSTQITSDSSVSALADAIRANSVLQNLNLSYNKITLRGCKMLREAIIDKQIPLSLQLEGNSGERIHPGLEIKGGKRY